MKRAHPGTVLVQVMIMSLIMVTLATILMNAIVHQSTVAAGVHDLATARKRAQAILNVLESTWASDIQGRNCTGIVGVVACVGAGAGTCNCVCSVTANGGENYPNSVTAAMVAGVCRLEVRTTYSVP